MDAHATRQARPSTTRLFNGVCRHSQSAPIGSHLQTLRMNPGRSRPKGPPAQVHTTQFPQPLSAESSQPHTPDPALTFSEDPPTQQAPNRLESRKPTRPRIQWKLSTTFRPALLAP